MVTGDVEGVVALAEVAFVDLDRRHGRPERPPRRGPGQLARHTHLLATDPDGQWVAEDGDALVGAACALRREGLWGLSLLVVRPGTQGVGVGGRLLDAALRTARDATGAIIVSSDDPRAIRRYARAGFDLAPTLSASGTVRADAPARPGTVREGTLDDLPLTARVDHAVREAARPADLAVAMEMGVRLLVADDGYVLLRESQVLGLAALDTTSAADLLRAALLELDPAEDASVRWLTEAQQWAVGVLLDAGLDLRPSGPVCTRGAIGPLVPYLPTGPFL